MHYTQPLIKLVARNQGLELFSQMDVDGNGAVTFEEFRDFVLSREMPFEQRWQILRPSTNSTAAELYVPTPSSMEQLKYSARKWSTFLDQCILT
jgi:hypothetical protein